MIISEMIQIGSKDQDGLFNDWTTELQKYVMHGLEFYSPQKHIFAEWNGFHFAGARMIRLRGRGSVRQVRTHTLILCAISGPQLPTSILQISGRCSTLFAQ
jgi:hypothetical protein